MKAHYIMQTDLSGRALLFNVRDMRLHICVEKDHFTIRHSNNFQVLQTTTTLANAKVAMKNRLTRLTLKEWSK